MNIFTSIKNVVFPLSDIFISDNGCDLIKRFEDLRLRAYQDQRCIWTVGWGHIDGVKPETRIDLPTACRFFREDISVTERAVKSIITVALNQNQYDALVSFTFNVGRTNLSISTLAKRLNTGDYGIVPSEMMRWNKVKIGESYTVSNGLVVRRRLESELFARA